jgi:cell wall-associated NlpC family hydrolase
LQQYLGTPYVYGGLSPETGWDCSGFLYWADQSYGNGDIPPGSHEQYDFAAQNGLLKNDPSELAVGDAVFFDTGFSYRNNGASHVAVYIGDGKIMHAENAGAGTVISDFNTYLSLYPYLGGASLL